MKSNNCLRIACLHLAYVSPLGERVPNQRMQLAPPTLGYATKKNHAPTLDGDGGMNRCHYAMPFKGISIMSTPEIVLVQESEDEKRAKLDDKGL